MKIHNGWLMVLPIVALMLGACSTQPGTIFEIFSLDDGTSLTTGARQRVISNIEPGIASRPGRVDPIRIICVEPSPDVAIAVANSFGAGISILGQGSGSLTGTQIEGVAQLAERTVAIQALLKQGYQACLDYANGAITGTTYSLRTSRLDDLMVTLILSEVAGGAFGRSGATIGTQASAEASAKVAGLTDMLKDLDKAKADLAAADKEVKEKEEALAKAEKALEEEKDDTKKPPLNAKVKTAKAELAAARANRNVLIQRMTALAETTSQSAGEVNELIALGGLTPKPDPAIAKELGAMQKRFIDKDVGQAYIQTCLVELGMWKNRTDLEKEYQKYALELIKKDPDGITKINSIPFFLSGVFGAQNALTEHCEKNLKPFVEKVHADRQIVRLKELENESKRLDILSRQAVTKTEKTATIIHPLASFSLLKKDEAALKAQKARLAGKVIPPVSATFLAAARQKLVAEKAALTKIVDALLGQAANALSPSEKAELDRIEDRYITIVTNTGRVGSPSERKVWQADFNLQQANAEAKDKKLKGLSKKLKDASDEVDALVQKIEAVK